MRLGILLLLLMVCPVLAGNHNGQQRPVWREDTKPVWKHGSEGWVKWPEQTRPMHDKRPLWKRIASSFAIWSDASDIQHLADTAPLGQRLRNYEIAIGIKFTIYF